MRNKTNGKRREGRGGRIEGKKREERKKGEERGEGRKGDVPE